ncbi:MAG TPA: BamA/TamA family outer membrane protein [Candidatus Eisenbacteria bacterium]
MIPTSRVSIAALLALSLAARAAPAAASASPSSPDTLAAVADTLRFEPVERARELAAREGEAYFGHGETWLRPPFGDHLLTDPDQWRSEGRRHTRTDLVVDYNRVDPLRLGLAWEGQIPGALYPRLGARYAYATGRERGLYGVQIEQPLVASGRYAIGASMVRVTDHNDLQQVEDLENSLALLFARTDYRDYFEREGYGAYLAWRVPDFSTVSVHLRSDDYRTIPLYETTRSWFYMDRPLRPNPPIDEGTARTATLRLERLAHRTRSMRAGLYHWIELEAAGGQLGGDFEYTRALADMRAILRVSPATTLLLRGVGGHAASGRIPVQKEFVTGGADGLRAHPIGQYRGDQMLLGQAEYVVGLWRLRSGGFEGGLHAVGFIDAGRAWFNPGHEWDVGRQRFAADAGFGLGTSEDNLRIYFAKNLQDPSSDLVMSVRLQRPF